MSVSVSEQLPLVAAAPNGIKKLRELILELAVRGKLVVQDPGDEPASELLKRIAAEKKRLEAEAKIKRSKAGESISEDEKEYELPAGWVWARIAAIGHDWGQMIPRRRFTYIDVGSVDNNVGQIREPQVLGADGAPSRARKLVRPGTVVYSTVRPYLLNVAVVEHPYDPEPIASTAFAVVHPHCEMPSRFFFWYLRSPTFIRYVQSVQTGIAYPAINDRQFFNGLVPVPPLAEQHRIVAKVDELMALCDRLEAQQADAESAHALLVATLLDSMTLAGDSDDFAASWQRLSAHFHTLFTTESSIDALKQALLQLAVTGKLVSQDPNDESAGFWIARIGDEKIRLAKAGLLKGSGNSRNGVDWDATALPASWRWATLGELTLGMNSGWSPACEPVPSPADDVWGVLKTTAVQVLSYLPEENKRLPAHLEPRPDAEVMAGDILFTRAGPTNRVGVSCFVESTRPRLMISDKIIRFHPVEAGAYGRYIALCLNAGETAHYLETAKSGMAASQVNISQEKLKVAPIPMAPLPEQRRIVAKVDQLMALCDQLKLRLSQARQLNEQLANALVQRAAA